MADLRQIFTYPTNLATDYIDPVWVGDASSGFTRRIDDLIDGTYSAWLNPLAITATTSQVMQNVSKFGNYYQNVSAAGHLSRYDFWYQPLVVATKKLIDSESVTADVQSAPMVVTTSNAHEFEDGQRIATSGINGTWGLNIGAGNFPEMYAKVISNTELQISQDEALTNIIGFASGSTSFTIPVGALNYLNPFTTGSNSDTSCKYLTVDLTSLTGGYNLSIVDGQALTFNTYFPDPGSYVDPKIAPRTYYLKNTSTSSTDNIFEVYNEASLTNRIEFSDNPTPGSGVTFPFHNNEVQTNRAVTLNQTNPATLTCSASDPIAADETVVHVNQVNEVLWSISGSGTNRYFGPTNAYSNPAYWLIPTSDPLTFEISLVPPTAYNYPLKPNWLPVSSQTPFMEWSQLPQPQNTGSRLWAQVANGRIAWLKGTGNGAVEQYVDGTAIDLSVDSNSPGELWDDPYYLKNVPSAETATYKVFDIYKDSGLTTLYGPSDYQSGSPVTITAVANQPLLKFAASQGNNPPVTNYTLSQFEANADYPNWGIVAGETVTATWDALTSQWIVTSHVMTDLTLGDPAQGAPDADVSAQYAYAGSGADWSQGFFWAYQDLGTGSPGGTTATLDISSSLGTLNPGAGIVFNRDPVQYVAGGYIWYRWYGGTNSTSIFTDFQPVGTSGSKANCINGLGARYTENGINGPTSLPATNSGGYLTGSTYPSAFLTETTAPTPYNSIDGTGSYYLEPTGVTGVNTAEYHIYSNKVGTRLDKFDFNNNGKNRTGIIAAWDTSGTGLWGDLPVGCQPAAVTNFIWRFPGVSGTTSDNEWTDGQLINLYLTRTGHTTWTTNVYLKMTSLDFEFFTDAALTIPFLNADFITAYNTINGGNTPHADTRFEILAKEQVYHHPLGLSNSPQFNPIYTGKTTTTSTVTGANDTFNVNVYNQGKVSMTVDDQPVTSTTDVTPISDLQILSSGGNTGASITLPLVNTTTGQIGPHLDAASMPYEIDTVSLILPGNKKFLYNTSTPGAQANTNKYWNAGGTVPLYYSNGATSATFVTTVDTNGYLQNVTLTEEPDAEGRYPDGEDIIVLIEPLPDTVVPALSPAVQADVFDTHDEWVDNAVSPLKVWPNHVSPASANIVYNQPTNANMSQNGVKYTRGSGFTKWVLEVEYPGMKAKDFQKFHAMAQAMQGQSKSIYFPLRNKDDVSILWANMMDPGSSQSGSVLPDFVGGNPGYIPAGSLLLKLEGLTASDSEAFREGEVFIANANNNASLHTAIGAAASNAYGEAMVRMPYPLHSNLNQADIVDKDPEYAIVTLNSDAFEYSVDVNNYYYVTVTFDLDQWGS